MKVAVHTHFNPSTYHLTVRENISSKTIHHFEHFKNVQSFQLTAHQNIKTQELKQPRKKCHLRCNMTTDFNQT